MERTEDRADFGLVRVNDRGDSLWRRAYGGDDFDLCMALTLDEQGCLLAGTTHSFAEQNSGMWLLRTNLNGDSLWSRVVNRGRLGCAYAVQPAPDGGILVAGDMRIDTTDTAKGALVKIAPVQK